MNKMIFDLEKIFLSQGISSEQEIKLKKIRVYAHQLAESITLYTPESREQSIAVTKVREALMWANAALSCNKKNGKTG